MKYGKLTILDTAFYKNGNRYVNCICDCGNKKAILFNNIKRGLVKSCGCIVKTRNGKSKTKLFVSYKHMIDRCYRVNDISYKNYGGRGIIVCDDWKNDFMSFYNWAIENGYKDGLTIDRINTNGNYEPTNCRWVSMQIQQNNRSNNRILEYKGQRKTITQWAKFCGLSYRNLHYRLKNGYSVEQAIEKPKRCLKRVVSV